ncbi:hypothetical protein [Aeromicrobium sp. UC242_57]|uniref:hypothetical protein n=1 Tax=Aeromicrobium sp. UC242_57 TaxID=3374624 RepID=UPI0037ACDC5B
MSQRRLPAEIYWRRRLLVLAALIAVVWIGLRLFGGSDDEPQAAATTPPPAVTTTAAPVAKVNGRVDVSLVSATKACDPQKIRVVPSVKSGQLTKGPVQIGLVVRLDQQESVHADGRGCRRHRGHQRQRDGCVGLDGLQGRPDRRADRGLGRLGDAGERRVVRTGLGLEAQLRRGLCDAGHLHLADRYLGR